MDGELAPSRQLRITSPGNDSERSLSQCRRSARLAEAVSSAVEIRPDRERGRRRRGGLLAQASESEVRLQVVADQAGGKHTGDSRNRGQTRAAGVAITTPDRRGRSDAHLWRRAG